MSFLKESAARNARTLIAAVVLTAAAGALPAAASFMESSPWPRFTPPYGGPAVGPPVQGNPAAASGAAAGAAVNAVAAPAPANVAYNPNLPFAPEDQAALANVTAYLNSFQLLEGEFIQFGPSGEQSDGVFFLARPGKIRFHFRAPTRLDVIADGRTVAIKDGRTQTQDMYPLSKTPLRYLLAERINLLDPGLVNSVRRQPDQIEVVIVERSALADGQITMIFDPRTYELRQWVVTDAQGLNTSVSIFNTTMGKAQDPGLYRITVASPG